MLEQDRKARTEKALTQAAAEAHNAGMFGLAETIRHLRDEYFRLRKED